MFDPRLTPARPDLAADFLAGRVRAERYVEGRPAVVVAPVASVRKRPAADAPQETQFLYGQPVTVYEDRDGWSWVQQAYEGYVGYLRSDALGPPEDTTHASAQRVRALRTHAYPGPSIKLPPLMALSLGSRVQVVDRHGDFVIDAQGRHFWARHFADAETAEDDPVAVAEMFLHAPYLWGGCSSEGIDCSGLVQAALEAGGIETPRDSDMQEAQMGAILAAETKLKRGDLVFWKGHVGIMRDPETLLHANGYHMAVASEPLAEARARIAATGGGEVTSLRRLPNL